MAGLSTVKILEGRVQRKLDRYKSHKNHQRYRAKTHVITAEVPGQNINTLALIDANESWDYRMNFGFILMPLYHLLTPILHSC